MSATHLGFYNTASSRTHVRFQFSTHASAGGNVAPNSAFEAADLRIYKAADGAAFSATQRSSANGITMTSPFDSLTGYHDVDIDLTDNTDAGFYAAGCMYLVVLAPDETVDGQTLTGVPLAYFEIGVAKADVTQFGGSAITATGGRPEVNTSHIAGSAVSTSTAQIGVNVVNFGGSAGAFASGRPEVNTSHIGGSAISQSSGVANVNVAQISGDSVAADNLESYTDGTTPMPVNATQISGDATAADNLELAYDGSVGAKPWHGIVWSGTAQSVGATSMTIDASAAFAADVLIGCTVVITNGAAQGSRALITDNDASDGLTLGGWTGSTPSGTPTFDIWGSANGASLTEIGTAVWASATRTLTAATNITSTGGTTVPQTGDSYARLGAPAGASVSADVAAVKTDTGNLVTRITATLFSGITQLSHWLGAIAGKQSPNSTAQTEIRATGAGSGTYDATTDSQEAIRDRGDAAWTTATGFSTLDAAGVRTAVGLASANLDTQLDALPTAAENTTAVWAAATRTLTSSGGVKKNTALSAFTFFMRDSSDHVSGKTGLTVTATRSLDGAAFAACANAVTELSNGFYKIDLAAGDVNADVVALKFTATGADPLGLTIKTAP